MLEDTPKAPELPDWCFEEEEGVSDDDGEPSQQKLNDQDQGRPVKKMKRRPYNEVILFVINDNILWTPWRYRESFKCKY